MSEIVFCKSYSAGVLYFRSDATSLLRCKRVVSSNKPHRNPLAAGDYSTVLRMQQAEILEQNCRLLSNLL